MNLLTWGGTPKRQAPVDRPETSERLSEAERTLFGPLADGQFNLGVVMSH